MHRARLFMRMLYTVLTMLSAAVPHASTATYPQTIAGYAHIHFQEIPLEISAFGNGFMVDRYGFVWLGLQSGLAKWDGRKVTLFDTRNSALSSITITGVLEAASGAIWIMTQGGGLNRYDRQTNHFTTWRMDPANPHSLSTNNLGSTLLHTAMAADVHGNLWMASSAGLIRFDPRKQTFTRFLHDKHKPDSVSSNDVTSVIALPDGTLWVGTTNGLNVLATGQTRFKRILHEDNNPASLSDNQINALLPGRNGTIWVATRKGLDAIEASSGKIRHFEHSAGNWRTLAFASVTSLAEDPNGRIWIAYAKNVVTILDPQTGELVHHVSAENSPGRLRGENIEHLVAGPRGEMWIIDHAARISKYDPATVKFALYQAEEGNPDSLVSSIVQYVYCAKDGQVWLDGGHGYLQRYDPHSDGFKRFALYGKSHYPMLEDRQGRMWIGGRTADDTQGAIHLLDPRNGRYLAEYVMPRGFPTTRMIEDPNRPGLLWFTTTDQGLVSFDSSTHAFRYFVHDAANPSSIGGNSLWDLAVDRDDPFVFWIGSSGGGLNRFDTRTESFTRYLHRTDQPDSIASDTVFSFRQTRAGDFWVMAKGGGLDKFDRHSGTFEHFSQTNHRFPNDKAVNIAEDRNGNLWLNAPGGHLIRFQPGTGAWRDYHSSDGVQPSAAWGGAHATCEDGRIWFGGGRGLNAFYPDTIRDSQFNPPVVLTSLTQGGEPFIRNRAPELIDHITLDWRNNFFEFEVAALDLTHPEQNQYQYKLDGWDNDWYLAGNRNGGRYSGLPGGQYVLHVRGSNGDGQWSSHEVRLDVTVTPPFWRTWWFISLAIVLLCMMVAGIFWRRTASIRAHNFRLQQHRDELEQAVQARTNELRQAMDKLVQSEKLSALGHLVSGVAHELNTPLGTTKMVGSILAERLEALDKALKADELDQAGLEDYIQSGRESIRLLERNTIRAANLVSHFKQIAVDRASSQRRSFYLRQVADEVLTLMQSRLKGKPVTVEIDIAPDIEMEGFPGPLTQVLDNMMANSLIHAFDGSTEGHIRLSAAIEGDTVRLIYEDDGKGMDETVQKRIFDPFFTTQLGQGGSGLGMYMVYNLINGMLGGSIELRSQPGKGVSFTIILPRTAPEAGSPATP
ncbi:SMP-30/gluconolactonase/LRE family protein [Burkholderiaceae bacterium DAT-1]|nr:SMP-30/gluconolactonase/LRE family protein [Burkholderiaceae bacterium DAT-1]